MLIQVDEYQLLNAFVDRVKFWKNDDIIINLYSDMYDNRISNGYFCEDVPIDINMIVDNDVVNYTSTVCKEDYPEDYQLLPENWEEGDTDVSVIDFNDISASRIKAYDSYNEIFLVSYRG